MIFSFNAPFGDGNCGASALCGMGLPASHRDFSRDRLNRCAVQLDDGVVRRHPVCGELWVMGISKIVAHVSTQIGNGM